MANTPITVEQVRPLYADTDTAHDFEHILRVMRMAIRLAEAEGGDVEVVRTAALLHDLERHAEDSAARDGNSGVIDHAEASAFAAQEFLIASGAEDSFAGRVAEAIRSHRYRGTIQPGSLEARILFDADKLDSIGAIGVARAYAVGGMHNRKLYSEPNSEATAVRGQQKAEHTPVDEYYVKLRHLHTRFYTPAAQRLAEGRHRFMVEFFNRLESEVHGEI
jgi:uncharacterized protein